MEKTENKNGAVIDQKGANDRKSEGQNKASNVDPKWFDDALKIVETVAKCRTYFLIDEIRIEAVRQGLPPQPKKGAWGAVTRQAARDGIIVKTERYRPSKLRSNNAGIRTVWKSALKANTGRLESPSV